MTESFISKDPSWDDDGWTKVPNEIARDRSLSAEARGTILFLASHASDYKITMDMLRLQMGMGREKLTRVLREIEAAGYLEREPTFQKVDGMNRQGPNRYRLLRSRAQAPDSQTSGFQTPGDQQIPRSTHPAVSQASGNQTAGDQTSENRGGIKKTKSKKTSNYFPGEQLPLEGPAPARRRGTRIPDGFAPTVEMIRWCQSRFPGLDGKTETEKFINFWTAKTGAGATKLDWPATWRNWMINAADRKTSRPSYSRNRSTVTSNGAVFDR